MIWTIESPAIERGCAMSDDELIAHWVDARRHIVLAQLGPIFLLTSTIALLQFGLADASLVVRLAAAGVLLATGILGAAAQVSAAIEARAIARELSASPSVLGRSIAALGPWTAVVRIGTPAIFVLIFVALLVALFVPDAS